VTITLKAAVYKVMPEAYAAATGDGSLPTSVRSLYYQVRPRIQALTSATLEYAYFGQDILVTYERDVESLPALYREPRGELHEPHDGESVRLGTREVDAYVPPDWTFNKVLYVEKEGLWPVIENARLGDRFDLAIIMGAGHPTEACRALLENAAEEVRLFVLHDADPAGYDIGRVLGEATWRMPDHDVEIIDLGLVVSDAIANGLPRERFSRKKAMSEVLIPRLTDTERHWFRPEIKTNAPCIRVELNAFTGPDLIAFIERRLADHGATGKVVPPLDVVRARADAELRVRVLNAIEARIREILRPDDLAVEIAAGMGVATTPEDIAALLHESPLWSWRTAVAEHVRDSVPDVAQRAADELRARRGVG
jgi:hypothetical protein